MRILYVCSDFGIPVFGHKGASVHLRAMACALRDLGHDVTVLSPATAPCGNPDFDVPVQTLAPSEADRATVRQLRRIDTSFQPLDSGHEPRLAYEVRNLLYTQTVAGAAERLAARGVDLIYERYALFANGGLALARELGVPHVLEVNAPLVQEQGRARGIQLRELALRIEKQVWCGSGAVLVVSEQLRQLALEYGVAAERVQVVPNGVDPALFDVAPDVRERLRNELDAHGCDVVGFVGSLKSWHGTEVLLRAFAKLRKARPDTRLWIVGDGPMRDALQSEVAALGLADAVHFAGVVDHARVPQFIAAMDVAVAPYLPADAFYFSPIKIYEYMACGVPVVASKLGQVVPLDEAGLVTAVEPGDVDALAAALGQALEARQTAAHRARQARDWVLRTRTWSVNARQVVAIGARSAHQA